MKILLNLSMFLLPPVFTYMIHVSSANCMGGGTAIVENV